MMTMSQTFLAAAPAVTKITDLPPGPCTVVISAIGTGASVSVGTGTSLTSTNGMIVNAGQSITIPLMMSTGVSSLYGTGIGGTAIVGVTISSSK